MAPSVRLARLRSPAALAGRGNGTGAARAPLQRGQRRMSPDHRSACSIQGSFSSVGGFCSGSSGVPAMKRVLCFCTLIWLLLGNFAVAQSPERRIALVIGNAAYQTGALATAANDAGLIAQTLQAAGFDVVGARDLDQDTLRRAFRDFFDKAEAR